MNQYPLFDRWLHLIAQFDNANAMIFMVAFVLCMWILILKSAAPGSFKWARYILDYSWYITAGLSLIIFLLGAK